MKDDTTFFYRDYASASSSKAADAKEYYTNLLGIKSKDNISRAERVCAGYLHCREDKEEYYIHPCRGKTFFRVNKNVHDSNQKKNRTASAILALPRLPIYWIHWISTR